MSEDNIHRWAGVLAKVEGRNLEAIFLGIWFLYISILVITATSFRQDVRLFPIVIGVLVLVLTALRFIFLLFSERISFDTSGIFGSLEPETSSAISDHEARSRYIRVAAMIAWLIILLCLVWSFGFLLSLPVFVFSFVYYHDRNLKIAIISGIFIWVFIYLLFVELLSAPTYSGAIFSFDELTAVVNLGGIYIDAPY